jgi:hypothetical protein
MFFYIETIFRDPDRQRSIKIAVEGKTHFLVLRGIVGLVFFSLKVKNSVSRNRVRQQSKTIAVEGTIFAFGFLKK